MHLVVLTDDSFIQTWGESSVFLMLANGKEYEPAGKKKRWFTLFLLLFMIVGATVGELPAIEKYLPEGIKLDMFFFVSITTVIMAWSKIFPPQKYTKYISWDILITIACAFAISKAMENSGVADLLAGYIIEPESRLWPLRIAGRTIYHYEHLYRAYYQQCSGRTGFPHRLVPFHPVRCQPDALLRGHTVWQPQPVSLPLSAIRPT